MSTKVHLVKFMVFPIVMYGCESWIIKKAECRIHAFELWCWRKLLRVPWTARRSKHSILKEISPGCHWKDWCRSWNSSTLATWFKELTHWTRSWYWARLKAGGRWGQQRVRWLGRITDSMCRNLSKLQDIVEDWEDWCAAIYGLVKSQTWLSNWTTVNVTKQDHKGLPLGNSALGRNLGA